MRWFRNMIAILIISIAMYSAFLFLASGRGISVSNAEKWNLHEDYDKDGNPLIDIRDLVSAKKKFGENPDIHEATFLVELRKILLGIPLNEAEEPEQNEKLNEQGEIVLPVAP